MTRERHDLPQVISQQLDAAKDTRVNNRKKWYRSKINITQIISTAILIVGIFQSSPAFAHYAIGLGIAGDVLTVILRSMALEPKP